MLNQMINIIKEWRCMYGENKSQLGISMTVSALQCTIWEMLSDSAAYSFNTDACVHEFYFPDILIARGQCKCPFIYVFTIGGLCKTK